MACRPSSRSRFVFVRYFFSGEFQFSQRRDLQRCDGARRQTGEIAVETVFFLPSCRWNRRIENRRVEYERARARVWDSNGPRLSIKSQASGRERERAHERVISRIDFESSIYAIRADSLTEIRAYAFIARLARAISIRRDLNPLQRWSPVGRRFPPRISGIL